MSNPMMVSMCLKSSPRHPACRCELHPLVVHGDCLYDIWVCLGKFLHIRTMFRQP